MRGPPPCPFPLLQRRRATRHRHHCSLSWASNISFWAPRIAQYWVSHDTGGRNPSRLRLQIDKGPLLCFSLYRTARARCCLRTRCHFYLGRRPEPEAPKSGSAAGPFCGRGRGPPELGEAVKAKPLWEARDCCRPSSAASRESR